MAQEITNPDGLGGARDLDPATLAAWQEGMALKDKTVYDVNGLEMGKVSRAFAEEGTLLRFDVALTSQAKRLFSTDLDVAGVPPIAIADVSEDAVKLSEAGEQILHPDDATPPEARREKTGARELPRKVR